jgi:2-polyprenyl-3-methyl-5-hydroxy-6-metoxy-1,4-benzoquinol methylase
VRQFDFGQNWSDFSSSALTAERVAQARTEFSRLMEHAIVDLEQKSFLDIGFGQGLSLLAAASLGARAVGCDINPKCGEVLARNRVRFPELAGRDIPVAIGSILDEATIARLREISPTGGTYDIVHSWGVLHHTGRMWKAVDLAADLVAPGGVLVLALYNRHWSSPIWKTIKRVYCASPKPLQRVMVGLFYPFILVAKWLVTGRNPFDMERGMDFYYNFVDWVGGYPYEYARMDEVTGHLVCRGFMLQWQAPAKVPTGCNEQIFMRRDTESGDV